MSHLRHESRWCVVLSMALAPLGSTVSASAGEPASPPRVEARGREDDLREAVFRYLLAKYGHYAKVHFLNVGGNRPKDPPPGLLDHLLSDGFLVKPASAAERPAGAPRQYQLTDPASGKRAIYFTAGKLRWVGADRALVTGGYHLNGKGALNTRFLVELRNGKWRVEKMAGPTHMALGASGGTA